MLKGQPGPTSSAHTHTHHLIISVDNSFLQVPVYLVSMDGGRCQHLSLLILVMSSLVVYQARELLHLLPRLLLLTIHLQNDQDYQ